MEQSAYREANSHSANQTESELLYKQRSVSQSVSQSVRLGVEPLRDSWPHFDCSQDSCGFVCHGTSCWEDESVLWQVTVLVCVKRYIQRCIHMYILIFWFYVQNIYVLARSLSPGFVQQIMPSTYMLPVGITTT